DGKRTPGENGQPGVTIYLDANDNSFFDTGETFVITRADDPLTAADETGRYAFTNLAPGFYVIREVVPEGFIQTCPHTLLPNSNPHAFDTSHRMQVSPGQSTQTLDFGNQPRIAIPD